MSQSTGSGVLDLVADEWGFVVAPGRDPTALAAWEWPDLLVRFGSEFNIGTCTTRFTREDFEELIAELKAEDCMAGRTTEPLDLSHYRPVSSSTHSSTA